MIDIVNEIGKQGPVLFINDRPSWSRWAMWTCRWSTTTKWSRLMEMAMSGNQAYLNRFHDDLENHRFAAIISGRQNTVIKQEGVFAEENNVWNTFVSPYILCYYESNTTIEADDSADRGLPTAYPNGELPVWEIVCYKPIKEPP
ncbi:MAG: hypothetical protein M0C28_33785 [Candidatus Moduliflexus flocculans]|nr:hypothetical protein [Candidatus Moduliflexus flocculans]